MNLKHKSFIVDFGNNETDTGNVEIEACCVDTSCGMNNMLDDHHEMNVLGASYVGLDPSIPEHRAMLHAALDKWLDFALVK